MELRWLLSSKLWLIDFLCLYELFRTSFLSSFIRFRPSLSCKIDRNFRSSKESIYRNMQYFGKYSCTGFFAPFCLLFVKKIFIINSFSSFEQSTLSLGSAEGLQVPCCRDIGILTSSRWRKVSPFAYCSSRARTSNQLARKLLRL